jgi:hypothetical protein
MTAGVKKLFLFHHDPGHDDEHIGNMEAQAKDLVRRQDGFLEVEAAREGLEHELSAPIPVAAAVASA